MSYRFLVFMLEEEMIMKKRNRAVAIFTVLTMLLSFAFMNTTAVFADNPAATPNVDRLKEILSFFDNKLYISANYAEQDIDEDLVKEVLTSLIDSEDIKDGVSVESALKKSSSDNWEIMVKETSNSLLVPFSLTVLHENKIDGFNAVYIPPKSFETADKLFKYGEDTFYSPDIARNLADNFGWVEPDNDKKNGLLLVTYDVLSFGEYETYLDFNAPAGKGVSVVLESGETAEDIVLGSKIFAEAKTADGNLCSRVRHQANSPYGIISRVYWVGDADNADLKDPVSSIKIKVEGSTDYVSYPVSKVDVAGGTPGGSDPGTGTPGGSDPGSPTPGSAAPAGGSPGIGFATAPGIASNVVDSNKDADKGSAASDAMFSDISGHWAKDAIIELAKKGILKGVGNGIFAPESVMTRGAFVTLLGRGVNINTTEFEDVKFADVPKTSYYAPYVDWAAKNKIVAGMSESVFSPKSTVTREQMAVMLVAYLKSTGKELPEKNLDVNFSDAAKISDYAASAVQAAAKAGLLAGKNGNIFDPVAPVTRAEAAKVIHLLLEMNAAAK